MTLKTPVLFIIFNRPSTTEKVFEQIRKVRPTEIYLAADGPRENKPGEKEKCERVREIVSKIDWPCKVHKKFSDKNLGCKIAESSAISWFFENVNEGIILEDDDLPNQSFFKFCTEMLEKYRDDKRIMNISGSNFQRGWRRDKYSYYFSKQPHIWGFATWKRAWDKYDLNTKLYPELKAKGYFRDTYEIAAERKIITRNLDSTFYNKFNTWDYQWVFALLINNGLSIIPNENLIQNIGMDSSAVHTSSVFDREFSLPTKELKFPLDHPPFVIRDKKSDDRYFRWLLLRKIRNTLLRKTGLVYFFKIKE